MNTIRNPVDLYALPLPQARMGLDRLAVRLTKVTMDRKNILSYCLCGRRESVLVVAGLLLVSVSLALGQTQPSSNGATNQTPAPINAVSGTFPTPIPSGPTNLTPIPIPTVVVTGTSPSVGQSTVDPSLGVRVYTINTAQIQNMPQGEDTSFAEVIEQSPGVSQDAYGSWHVRGEDTEFSYLLNGIRIPRGIVNSIFGQKFDTHFISKVSLLDGALPAPYGLWTGGIFDITTKQGSELEGGDASIYGGSYDTVRANFSFGGVYSNVDFFFQGGYDTSDNGIENPTNTSHPLHDHTYQDKGFLYLCDHLDKSSQLTVMLNGSYGGFQIPNTAEIPVIYTLPNISSFHSADLNETQIEQYHYGIVSYKKKLGDFSMQSSLISSYAQTWYRPDWIGDLMINGLASEQNRSLIENTWATDVNYQINDRHTLRGGAYLTSQIESTASTTSAFRTDSSGTVLSDIPIIIGDGQNKDGYLCGLYLEDQWVVAERLTAIYGMRFDQVEEFVNENQLSPRINLVYQATPATTLFAGYSRFFTPTQLEYLSPASVQKYENTTAATPVKTDDKPKAERSNYYDAGVTHKVNKDWSVGLEGYYNSARNFPDEAQVGNSEIYTPFSYARGDYIGSELTSSYARGGFSAFANLELSRAMGTDINSSQLLFGQDELNYTAQHYVHLNHDQTITLATGAAYTFSQTTFHVDAIYGSGFYDGFADLDKVPAHCPVNCGVRHDFKIGRHQMLTLRCDVLNVFDEIYVYHHGAGIGTTAPYYGERRGIFAGLNYKF
jgi:outer membrane receptor protein involved in Fe transport